MDRKRSAEATASQAPRKAARIGGASPRSAAAHTPPAHPPQPPDDDTTDSILLFQRAQLAAKLADQARELEAARTKIDEVQAVVAALAAAPAQAAYVMAACIEDLELMLAQAGVNYRPSSKSSSAEAAVDRAQGDDGRGSRDPDYSENNVSGREDMSGNGSSGGRHPGHKNDPNCEGDEELDVRDVPLAAALLEDDVSVDTLSEQPALLRRVTARVLVEFKKARSARYSPPSPRKQDIDADARMRDENNESDAGQSAAELRKTEKAATRAAEDLHKRFRKVSDQLERYASRDKENLVTSGTLRDELDELRALLDIRRRKIVALELVVSARRKHSSENAIVNAVASSTARSLSPLDNGLHPNHDGSFVDQDDPNSRERNDVHEELASQQRLAEARLEELNAMLEEKKALAAEVQSLSTAISQRAKGVIPAKDVQASAVYRAMEASLQQLYVKERAWEAERASESYERGEERKDAAERLEQAKAESDKEIEELRKQVEDLRRVAESAKAEKDQWAMTYQAGKVDNSGMSALVDACERRASRSESLGDKLKTENDALRSEVANFRQRVTESELRVIEKSADLPNGEELAKRLETDLQAEREKCSLFIAEVESLSNVFGEVESENARLRKLLAEKEAVLSKVMGDRLRKSQQLTTVEEEARSLAQGREIDQERVKNLTQQVNASKRVALEAAQNAAKATEEARILSIELAVQKKVSEEASVAARVATSEKEEMQTQRDTAASEAESVRVAGQTNAFVVKRLTEENEALKKRLADALSKRESQSQTNGGVEDDEARRKNAEKDQLIQGLMKKLQCSIVPNQPKEVALARCGHMMSRECVSQLVARRSRKCPLCGLSFSESDVLNVYLDDN